MPYQQIDKKHYPQLYKNKRQRVVLSAIGTGREQGAHLRDLHRATGFGERSVRKVIEDIRRAGVVVCNSLDGYFFPRNAGRAEALCPAGGAARPQHVLHFGFGAAAAARAGGGGNRR